MMIDAGDLDPSWNLENMEVIAFLSDATGGVIQAQLTSILE